MFFSSNSHTAASYTQLDYSNHFCFCGFLTVTALKKNVSFHISVSRVERIILCCSRFIFRVLKYMKNYFTFDEIDDLLLCVAIYRKSADFSVQHFCEWKHHHVHSLCERMQMINTRPLKYVLLQKKTKYSLSIWSFYGSRIFLLSNEMFWKRIARCRDTFDEITRSTAKLIAPASSSDQLFSIGASVSSYKEIRFFVLRIAQKRVYIFQIWQSANFTPLLCVFHTSLLAMLR